MPTSRQNFSFIYTPKTTSQVTYYLMAKNSIASDKVQIGAFPETFYFSAEEILQATLAETVNLAESEAVDDATDATDSDDSWDRLELK